MWTILIQNKRFEGIRPTPNPKPNPDGNYTVTLTTTQFKVFEENQKKPAIPVEQTDVSVTVTQESSAY